MKDIDKLNFQWNRGQASVTTLGAMLSDLSVELDNGHRVAPLHKAPWLGESLPSSVPPLLANLQGEWPCIPFGVSSEQSLPTEWQVPVNAAVDQEWPHGYAANHSWLLGKDGSGNVNASLDYPLSSAVEKVTRTVKPVHGEATLNLELCVEMRRNAKLPLGLHPVFALPTEIGAVRINPGTYSSAINYPGYTGGKSVFTEPHGRYLSDLVSNQQDVCLLPYATPSESIVLLTDSCGKFELVNNANRYRLTLSWDNRIFPSLMLWISNRGRDTSPWNSRHLALGVEPVCSAFDFGQAVSSQDNPLTQRGFRTAVSLTADKPFSTHYQIKVEAI